MAQPLGDAPRAVGAAPPRASPSVRAAAARQPLFAAPARSKRTVVRARAIRRALHFDRRDQELGGLDRIEVAHESASAPCGTAARSSRTGCAGMRRGPGRSRAAGCCRPRSRRSASGELPLNCGASSQSAASAARLGRSRRRAPISLKAGGELLALPSRRETRRCRRRGASGPIRATAGRALRMVAIDCERRRRSCEARAWAATTRVHRPKHIEEHEEAAPRSVCPLGSMSAAFRPPSRGSGSRLKPDATSQDTVRNAH